MAHGHKSNEKVVYVGDSRVKKSNHPNIPPDYTSFPGKSEAFIPNFLLKEWMVGCVVLVGFLVWTIAEPAPLGYPADPTNAAFIPMPDWYFLFLYQFLKYPYVSQDYIVLGTIGIPGVMFGALLLAPFLDTGKERRFYRRPIASSLMGLTLIACIYLTVVSWDHYQHQLEINGQVPEHHEREEKAREAAEKGEERPNYTKPAEEVSLIDANDPAMDIAKQAQCIGCHAADLKGQGNAPSLVRVGDEHTKEELAEIITNGKGTGMPPFKESLSAEEIDQLATWLSKQKTPAE
ncbi:menaquinol-cytochrome c reductase cytochrome b/c subunit [Paenibacillus harenae]|uniref:Menaquinol-cytochrome c reductase cytochrome b/c subunit n=1 Tax=Paenibacillus harenae TaxID=306543 RepID=A0ABT9TVW7_PAEHA|nr:menaquinol-cytochrome c reductase cytochrome b/c subunit [Paenibacillus harenae]MDQ0058165.1 menaquinol-cytochrome c reductase cytochrome b/c subunit [Paenibacillus harenae]MDQ0111510.1 menaquinol-cytochrome c reductase cytochrome b/c subunit [Paenibacillus harenae]